MVEIGRKKLYFKIIIVIFFFLLQFFVSNTWAVDDGEELLVPKSYSNLRIPHRRRRPVQGVAAFAGVPYAGPSNDRNNGRSDAVYAQPYPPRPNFSSEFFAPFPGPPGPSGPVTNDTQWPLVKPGDGEAVPVNPNVFVAQDVPSNDEDEDGGVLNVDVVIQIQSVREVDEAEQKITLELDLTVHWKDYSFLPGNDSYIPSESENVTWLLKEFGGEPLPLSEFEKLWKPDIFIERVVKVTKPGLLSSPITVRCIKPVSSIVYTTRASVKVDCNMNFQYYPADTQNCFLDMRSCM